MKKVLYFMLLGLGLVVACDPNQDSETLLEDSREIVVNLALEGDLVTFNSEPVQGGRVSTGELTYYIVEIRQTGPSSGIHARGFFDHLPDSLPLVLLADRTYFVYAWALRAGDSNGIFVTNGQLSLNGNSYDILNEFEYNSFFDTELEEFRVISEDGVGNLRVDLQDDVSPADVYIGERVIDTSVAFDSVFAVDMARNVYGWNVQIANLGFGRSLRVIMANNRQRVWSDRTFSNTDSVWTVLRSMKSQNWTRDPSEEVSFNESVTIILSDTIDGIAQSTVLFGESVPFHRLQSKQVLITVPSDTTDNGGTDPETGFSIDLGDQPLVVGDTLEIGG